MRNLFLAQWKNITVCKTECFSLKRCAKIVGSCFVVHYIYDASGAKTEQATVAAMFAAELLYSVVLDVVLNVNNDNQI